MNRKRWQFSLRSLMIFVVFASLLLAYFGSYYRISRRNMWDVDCGWASFDYTAAGKGQPANLDTREASIREGVLRIFFAPANWIERTFFGGPQPLNGTRNITRYRQRRASHQAPPAVCVKLLTAKPSNAPRTVGLTIATTAVGRLS